MWELTLYFTADENGSPSAESNMSLPHNVNQSIAIWLYSSILSTYQKRIVKTSISTSTQEKGTACRASHTDKWWKQSEVNHQLY